MKGDFMKKRYVICGVIICFIAIVIYLQFGREEIVVNTKVDAYEEGYEQEVCVVANKLFIWDKERYAEELVEKMLHNKLRNAHFSYDAMGYPKEIRISVWHNKLAYQHSKKSFIILYSSENRECSIV